METSANHIMVKLTKEDRLVLESYKGLAQGLSNYLGNAYEIVLHSLESLEHSVIHIVNGFHTGRQECAPITDLALEMLADIQSKNHAPYISYFCQNKEGEPLKSTTIAICGKNQVIIGLLCINCYLNTPFSDVLATFSPQSLLQSNRRSETFTDNMGDMIEATVVQVREDVYHNPRIPANMRNRCIVQELQQKGIFQMKDGVVRTANLLRISKNTVYMHLRNI